MGYWMAEAHGQTRGRQEAPPASVTEGDPPPGYPFAQIPLIFRARSQGPIIAWRRDSGREGPAAATRDHVGHPGRSVALRSTPIRKGAPQQNSWVDSGELMTPEGPMQGRCYSWK